MSVVSILVFTLVGNAQVMTTCLTMEQSQAQYNQQKANSIQVVNTATQQQQTYYQQLATYWQQRDKDNQQKAKDLQQIAKDQQQKDTDARQVAADRVLAERTACLNAAAGSGYGYDEVVAFIEAISPYADCSPLLKAELKRIKTNRSGHVDGTNPGGQTSNIRGFDNPSWVIVR